MLCNAMKSIYMKLRRYPLLVSYAVHHGKIREGKVWFELLDYVTGTESGEHIKVYHYMAVNKMLMSMINLLYKRGIDSVFILRAGSPYLGYKIIHICTAGAGPTYACSGKTVFLRQIQH